MMITRCNTKQEMEESDEYMNRKSRKNGRGREGAGRISILIEKGVTMGEVEDG